MLNLEIIKDRKLIREAKDIMEKSMASWEKDNQKEAFKYIRNKGQPSNAITIIKQI